MNGKLLSSVVLGFVVVASLMGPTQAISSQDLRQLLRKYTVQNLKNLCDRSKLPENQIEAAYTEIFRVYSDDDEMTERTRKNYDDFLVQFKRRDNPDYKKEMESHTVAVCEAIQSFFDRLEYEQNELNEARRLNEGQRYMQQIYHTRWSKNL